MRLSILLLALATMVPQVLATPSQIEANASLHVRPAPHPPILIDGDADFGESLSGVRSGHGTPFDPFVISDWAIGGIARAGIHLRNTSAWVVIRDVYVLGEGGNVVYDVTCVATDPECLRPSGIYLEHAANVRIERSHVSQIGIGIRMRQSENVEIDGVLVGRAGSGESVINGIREHASRNVRILNLTSVATTFPFTFDLTESLLIEGFDCSGAASNSLNGVSNATVKDSEFRGAGFQLTGVIRKLSILHSEFVDNPHGLRALNRPGDRLDGAFICRNTFSWITGLGAMHLPPSKDLVIRSNVISGTDTAIDLPEVETSEIDHNIIEAMGEDYYGFLIATTTSVRVHNNSILVPSSNGAGIFGPVDATGNWWGAADGPSGEGPGNGTSIRSDGNATFAPWLATAPASAASCGIPAGPHPGASGMHVAAHGEVGARMQAKAKVLGAPVHVSESPSVSRDMHPVALP